MSMLTLNVCVYDLTRKISLVLVGLSLKKPFESASINDETHHAVFIVIVNLVNQVLLLLDEFSKSHP